MWGGEKSLSPQSLPHLLGTDGELAFLHPFFPGNGRDNTEQDIFVQISGRLCDSWLTFYQATPHDSVSVTEGHGTQGELEFSVSWASPVPGVPHPQIPLWPELSPSLWPRDTGLPLILLLCVSWTEKGLQTGRVRAYTIELVGR